MVKEYSCHVGGVDLQDMLVAVYRTINGVKIYYLTIVFHLLDICVVNVWLLYHRRCSQRGITKCRTLYNLPVRNSTRCSQGREKTARKRGPVGM